MVTRDTCGRPVSCQTELGWSGTEFSTFEKHVNSRMAMVAYVRRRISALDFIWGGKRTSIKISANPNRQ